MRCHPTIATLSPKMRSRTTRADPGIAVWGGGRRLDPAALAAGRQGMPDLPPLPSAPPGRYRHCKGGEYEVLGVVRHSETLEPLVLYRPLSPDAGLWVRPYAMFFERVNVNGIVQPRFARVA